MIIHYAIAIQLSRKVEDHRGGWPEIIEAHPLIATPLDQIHPVAVGPVNGPYGILIPGEPGKRGRSEDLLGLGDEVLLVRIASSRHSVIQSE